MQRQHDRARQLANAICIPLGITLNFFPRSAADVGKITRAHESMFSAAGYTFAIWGLLFLAQLAYAGWQLLPSQRTNPTLRRLGWLTALNGLLEGAWTVAFSHEVITVSWVIMLTLLSTLALVELRGRRVERNDATFWLVRVTYGLNLGWIAVATLLDTTLFVYDVVGWRSTPFMSLVWCELLVCVAALAAVGMAVLRRNLAFGVAVAWGLVGIGVYRLLDAAPLAWLSFSLAAMVVVLLVVEGLGLRLHWRPVERLVSAGR